ncbi:MAG: hypothetical protein ACTHL3_08635 [Candidatus Nitrosocosmicus sp.]
MNRYFESSINEITNVMNDGEDILARLIHEISKTKGKIDVCIKITNNSSIYFTIEHLVKAIN